MSQEVTIQIKIILPDGVTPDVDYSTVPAVVGATMQALEEAPFPVMPPPDMFAEAQRVFGGEVKSVEPPFCRIHQKPLNFHPADTIKSGPKAGQPRAAFWSCGEKDANGRWCSSKQNAA